MGFLNAIMGNASEMGLEELEKEVAALLAPGENITKGYKLVRDFFIFTDKRLLMVDKQGLSGKKVSYHSIPYKNITQFSIETGGTFDMDADLKIWVSSSGMLEHKISKGCDILDLQRELAKHILK